jgi:hypothetical protein
VQAADILIIINFNNNLKCDIDHEGRS